VQEILLINDKAIIIKKMKSKIEIEVEKTLESINTFERYEGTPFLHTRVIATLENNQKNSFSFFEKKLPQLILKPYLLVFVVLINISSVFYFTKNYNTNIEDRDQYIDQFAEEFSLSASNYNFSTLIEEE